jgi:transcription elongation factor Elf1
MLRTPTRANLHEREREAARDRKWNGVRPLHLICQSCGHDGTVTTTLSQLKASDVKCSACGAYLWRNANHPSVNRPSNSTIHVQTTPSR